MLRADLHMHSVYSDGTLSIKKLLDYAKSKRLDIIAITDHDSTMGVDVAIAYGKEINIKVIPGLELSTSHNGQGNCKYTDTASYPLYLRSCFNDAS